MISPAQLNTPSFPAPRVAWLVDVARALTFGAATRRAGFRSRIRYGASGVAVLSRLGKAVPAKLQRVSGGLQQGLAGLVFPECAGGPS